MSRTEVPLGAPAPSLTDVPLGRCRQARFPDRRGSAPHAESLAACDAHEVEIELVHGNITQEAVDAIVTAANESLLGGGGVDGAIHAAAGPEFAEAGARIGPCDPGDAKATPGFRLEPRVQWIIHTVGPAWEGGAYGEADVLASCYRAVLRVADELGVTTLSIPAIATGLYGYPIEEAADIAVHTLRLTPTRVGLIRLVAFDDENHDALAQRLASDDQA